MPPKRRKASDKPGKEGGGPPSKKRTQDIPHESTATTNDTAEHDGVVSMMKVPELYKICIVDGDRREQADKVRVWEERGAISEIVWPFLVESVASDNAAEFLQGCELLVTFVSRNCRDGSFSSSGVVEALDAENVIDKLLDTLFYQTDERDVALQTKIVHFLIVVLSSDNTKLQKAAMKHVAGMPIWHWMPERRRAMELKKSAGLRRKFVDSEKRDVWIVKNVRQIMTKLQGHDIVHLGGEDQDADVDESATGHILTELWQFLHRSMELMIDLLSMVTTRLYLVTYLDAIHFTVHCRMALGKMTLDLSSDNDNNVRLTRQMLRRIDQLLTFPIKDVNHEHLTNVDVMSMYHSRATVLQKMAHRHFPLKLQHVIHAGVGLLCARQQKNSYLERSFAGFAEENLQKLLFLMRLVDSDSDSIDKEFMLKVLAHHLSITPYPMEQLKAFPLYPTESLLWDINIIPPSSRNLRSTSVLALPKLNRQFLSFQDYLLRNFELVRLESAYEIRSDLVDVIKRIRPVLRQINLDDSEAVQFKTEFNGWSRMALELAKPVSIVEVRPPKLGETSSSQVTAEIVVDLDACGEAIRNEWNAIGEFDNLFLVAVDASKMTGAPAPLLSENHAIRPRKLDAGERRVPDDEDSTFPQRFGVTLVRGCMVLHVRDEEGNILSDPAFEAKPKKTVSTKRIFKVALDPAQYSADSKSKAGTEIYQQINLVVRRHGRENNFKSVLETIRGLMEGAGSIGRVIPPWLQTVILGYGDPHSASYKSDTVKTYAIKTVGVNNPTDFLDYGDTFIDEKHLRESFAGRVVVDGRDELEEVKTDEHVSRRNYKVRMTEEAARKGEAEAAMEGKSYPFHEGVPGNHVRFTPLQVEAVRSGLSPGLTLVVGPPGTGKTDVAVQIIASLYHSFPTQRTVIVTHSNAALNDIFQKVMARGDVDQRYLVRLGSGEKSLQTDSLYDFTKIGRVAYSLERRGALLEEVQRMSESFSISGKAQRGADGSPAYTCGTADYFYKHNIKKQRKRFEKLIFEMSPTPSDETDVTSLFPFGKYFILEHKQITLGEARTLMERVESVFRELAEYRPFELLRSQRQRSDYLILKQARIVAMTCTHAAIVRSRLIELGFEYDNIVMEEAGQMLEIETFIPLLLQRGESDDSVSGLSRLKRICMMGDHNQLPPVVKNAAFSKFSNLDQSLFSRLIRLGVPFIQFDKQGRARAELSRLYSWRYNNLGNMNRVVESERFRLANPGFAHTFQIINVEDFDGRGESTPTAHFYQNVGEAEYVVALFQYMVLIGYQPSKISIITTYNGQKNLISDIAAQRCGPGTPFSGVSPKSISTVDQYQGQQNDIILLSLVRTEAVGHLRDVRRLVVAVSRARLGLYVVCREKLFASCHELKRTFQQFEDRPKKLQLVLGEHCPSERKADDPIPKDKIFEIENVAHLGSVVHSMQSQWIENQG